MATKDITDEQVCQAYADAWIELGSAKRRTPGSWATDLLVERTGQCEKVCYCAAERAHRRGLIEYGVSLRSGWLTDEGKALLKRDRTV